MTGRLTSAALRRGATLDSVVVKYAGERFPFPKATFDAVWSFQSLEHVHSPEGTFAEIARVLAPNGILFGSTSFLEAYHARSTFCYSPYGFKLLCDRHGLALKHLFSRHRRAVARVSRLLHDAIDRGATLPEVQSTLGHGNIATTSGYLHARPSIATSSERSGYVNECGRPFHHRSVRAMLR